MNNCSLAEKFLTFTFSADFIISQKSIDDFPKIYSFSFFATTVEQIRQRSASITFFGVSIKSQILSCKNYEQIRKFAGKSFCCNLIGSISNNDCDMIGQSPVPTKQRERNVVRKKAAVCGEERCVTSLKTAAKETTFYAVSGRIAASKSANEIIVAERASSNGNRICEEYIEGSTNSSLLTRMYCV